MKKILLIIVCVTLSQQSSFGQLTTTPPETYNFLDTIRVVLSTQDGVDFRIIHPEYGNAFWSQENLVGHIIERYDLSQTSSDFEIVSSVGDFYKRHGLHHNSGLIENTTMNASRPLSVVDLHSIQCGMYANKTASVVNLVVGALARDTIGFEDISLDGHQIMQYWDDDLGKKVFLDPDPGTAVFVPRNNGNLVSFDEIVNNPEILLDTTGSVWDGKFTFPLDPRVDYYNFMEPIIGTVEYYPSEFLSSDREILYRLPSGTELIFEQVTQFIYINITNIDTALLQECAPSGKTDASDTEKYQVIKNILETFPVNTPSIELDSACLTELLNHVQNEFDNTISDSLIVQALEHQRVQVSDTSYIAFDEEGSWHFSVTLPSGYYDEGTILLPHLLRSIEPSVTGIPFVVNGMTYSDSAFFRMYWPSGTSELGNPPEIDPATVQHGLLADIPQEIDSVTFTFYFNHKLFEFWKQSWEIFVESGSMNTDTYYSGEEDLVTSTEAEYGSEAFLLPNPVAVGESFQLQIDGKNVSTYTIMDILGKETSAETSGVYFILFKHKGRTCAKKLVVK